MIRHHIQLALALLWIGLYACSPTLAPAQGWLMPPKAPEGTPPTNSPTLGEWYRSLRNRDGSPCCGEGDAYPVEISEMPTCKEGLYDKEPGAATVTNPAPADIITQDLKIIKKPPLKGNLAFSFGCSRVTHEKYGNPLKTAIAFITPDSLGNIATVWCVVPLPPGS